MPFSFLSQDGLAALYDASLDGIIIERFDPPYSEAALQGGDLSPEPGSISKVVYANQTLRQQTRHYGNEFDLMANGLFEAMLKSTFDSNFHAQWRERPRTDIQNLLIGPLTRAKGQRQAPPLMLTTMPIRYNGYIHGCCSRVTDATAAINQDSDEHRALKQIEAFVRTENVPLICLEFATALPNPITSGGLNTAYTTSTITQVTDSAAVLFGIQATDLVGNKLITVKNSRIEGLFANSFPKSSHNELLDLNENPELLVQGAPDEERIYRVKPTFVFENGLAVEAWLRVDDETSKQHRARRQDALVQTRNLALEAASMYQFVVENRTGLLTIDETGFRAMGITNIPNHLDEWRALTQAKNLNISAKELEDQLTGKDQAVNFIVRLQNDVGEDRYLEIWSNANADANGSSLPGQTFGLYRDVTQSETLNRRLSEKKTLESLGVLAGGIAHDFNNLLMSVLGYAELMEAEVRELPQYDQNSILHSSLNNINEIRTAALRASELCTSLLAYAGQYLIEKKPVDLSDLVRTTAELLEVTVGKRSPIVLDLDPEVTINADKGQLTQVIFNLVGNAADAMEHQHGPVHIGVHSTRLNSNEQAKLIGQIHEPEERLACLTIRDTGSGMSAETLKRMYEPFYSTKSDGRGLGMAAVHGIVKNHGGGILVASTENEGTEFRVCFPLVEQKPTAEQKIVDSTSTTRKTNPSVLVVDDETRVRTIAAEMLRHLSCDVQEADSAEAALALISTHTFDYALLDITMPVMTGSELAEILFDRVPDLTIVLCSGYSDKDVSTELLKRCDFLHKPYTLKEMRDALHLA